MAWMKLPSYINEAGGRMEDIVIYRYGNKTYMRRYVIPHNPRTESQQANRSLFAEAMASWKRLPDADKAKYRKRTAKLSMHPHNLYVSEYMRSFVRTGETDKIPDTSVQVTKTGNNLPPFLLSLSEASPYRLNKRITIPVTIRNKPLRE